MDIDVGPVDPSVLYEQDLHVSSAVWEGQERGLLRCQEHTSLLHQWKLTDEQINLVDKAGFGYFRKIGPMSLNNSLISALVERWRRETNTFHLPLGEMTITLDEVALVLGLEIDGDPIVGSKVGDEVAMDMCGRLLGKLPSAANKEVNCSRVKLNWLKRTFSECPEDASFDVVKCHTRAYLLYLIGSTILLLLMVIKSLLSICLCLRILIKLGDMLGELLRWLVFTERSVMRRLNLRATFAVV